MINKRDVILNDGEKDVHVLVYLKEVNVRNNHTKIKSFCRIIKGQNAI